MVLQHRRDKCFIDQLVSDRMRQDIETIIHQLAGVLERVDVSSNR
jgi:hypothetical protein